MAIGYLTLGLIGPLGWSEMIVLALLGVLIFGKRLPEVGKSIGKGIVEFKKGLSGIDSDIEQAAKTEPDKIENKSVGQNTVETKSTEAQPHQATDSPNQSA